MMTRSAATSTGAVAGAVAQRVSVLEPPAPGAAVDGAAEPPSGTPPARRRPVRQARGRLRERLAAPGPAVALSVLGVLLTALVAAASPNDHTLDLRMPLALLPALPRAASSCVVGAAVAAQGLGLLGMLTALERGWRPAPRRLLAAGAVAVALLVCLTPVGSADTGSYAAYGRIAALGGDPYRSTPADLGGGYAALVGPSWLHTPSVYGPVATWIEQAAATVGGGRPWLTVWLLMLANGAAFLLTGLLLVRIAGDRSHAALLWAANPLLIGQLVAGGHVDTWVALPAVAALAVPTGGARTGAPAGGVRPWSDLLVGVLLGLACGVKVSALLLLAGLVRPALRAGDWPSALRRTSACLLTVAALYSGYGLHALAPLTTAAGLVSAPSLWEAAQWVGRATAGPAVTAAVIGAAWPVLLLVFAGLLHRRLRDRASAAVAATFALGFGWLLAAPWAMPWYSAAVWPSAALAPRSRITRWLVLVTMALALVHNTGDRGWTL